jgi:outer membrane protein assembly factor BamB
MVTLSSHQQVQADRQYLQNLLRQGLGVVKKLWSYPTEDWVTSVHAGDIDGDGDFEVIIGSRDGCVWVLTSNGDVKWKRVEERGEWVGSIYSVNNVRALDTTRVIAGMRSNKVMGLTETGKRVWSYIAGQVIRYVRVADIDRDGRAEVLVGSEDFCVHALRCETGELLWKYATNGWIRSIYPCDIDGDGEVEILAASGDKHIYILDHHGNLKKKHYTGSKIHALYASDLDHDGVFEILFASNDKDLCAMTPDGEINWHFSPENRIHSINVRDLDGDGYDEVIAGSEDGHIYFIDHQGKLIWKFFLGRRIFSVYPVDLDHNGVPEVLAGAEDNHVWVFTVELQRGLLAKIEETYARLGWPDPSSLKFSATELALLRDLTSVPNAEPGLHEEITTSKIEAALTKKDYFSALMDLLLLKHQRVQPLWIRRDLGHIRIIALNKCPSQGEKELIVGTDEGKVKVLTMSGQEIWSYSVGERIRSLDVADIDQDGEDELLVGSADGNVYALSPTEQNAKFQSHLGSWVESISVIHKTGTDIAEMVLGTRQSQELQIHRGNFQQIGKPFSIPQSVQILRTYDINGDGADEILAGAIDNGVYAYTSEGTLLWSYATKDRVKAIFACDIDQDGNVEVLVGSDDRYVYVLDCMGHLQWRYDTEHRVLALAALNANKDGGIEIFAGVGSGQLCVFNSRGDLLWRFRANDRIRSLIVEDLNGDGLTELVIATEDRLYMLQLLDRPKLDAIIEECWQKLTAQHSADHLLAQMVGHPNAYIRAFVLKRMAFGVVPLRMEYIQKLRYDDAIEVKRAFAKVVPLLSQMINQAEIRQLLDSLSFDREREIRMAIVKSFSSLCQKNSQLGFEYIERFTRNIDLWVLHTVVRQLDKLIPDFPQEVFSLLMQTLRTEKRFWVRQEAAHVLAHYLDIHTQSLLHTVRLLMVANIELPLLELVTYCAKQPLVQNVFQVFVKLLGDRSIDDILSHLEEVVTILQGDARLLDYGEVMYELHQEFRNLHRIRTIEEMAQYRCNLQDRYLPTRSDQANEETYFDLTLQVLRNLNFVTDALRTYLRRDGLGERISSLLDAERAIDKLSTEIFTNHYKGCHESFPDCVVLKLLLVRWRKIVHTELSQIRGYADLRFELRTRQVLEEAVVVPLGVENAGRSPADNVTVSLLPEQSDAGFTLVGSDQQHFITISEGKSIQAEFTIQPQAASLRLVFQITYDDAEAKGKEKPFAGRLDLAERKRQFERLQNPYYTGTAVQKLSMFYGREKEIALLQQIFVYSSAPAVVVLYGQRRSGKSSLIYKLLNTTLLDPHIPVRIDMQGETLTSTAYHLLHHLAYYIHRELKKRGYLLSLPDMSSFKEDAVFVFDRFLDDVEEWLGQRKLILLIDEFEVLDEKAMSEQIDHHFFDYLRSLVQERQCMHLLLAGTHKIQDLSSSYWSTFFNLANHQRLANLTEQAARRLIWEPVSDCLEYDEFAIEKIRTLTGDQPYLIQLFCHSLVRHCDTHFKDYITINDVNIVLEEVKQSGQVYFNWIWEQATREERIILAIIAHASGDSEQFVSFNDIESVFKKDYVLPYSREGLLTSLGNLSDSDVIVSVPHERRYKISVGIIRFWLAESKPIKRVILDG